MGGEWVISMSECRVSECECRERCITYTLLRVLSAGGLEDGVEEGVEGAGEGGGSSSCFTMRLGLAFALPLFGVVSAAGVGVV
jgi:hypothetical protein